jgi:UDP-N-acetylmuramoyl-L-alanyl-D-glutamate--2,6-diaminopimelate ligase
MRLTELIGTDAPGADAVEIAALAYDSRGVSPGTLFFCVKGEHNDGHDFAAQAVARGAAALVVERPLGLGVPEVVVPSTRAAMGSLAARFHGDPSVRLRVVGVTGTNGKTTTAYLVRALLEATGERCGLLGTVTSVVAGVERPVTRTTPEAIDVQGTLHEMLAGGDGACAMEVSSHALELERVAGVHFAAAIFTNLTQDHLDFHSGMEEYFQAKRRLFLGTEPPRVSESSLVPLHPRVSEPSLVPLHQRVSDPPRVCVINVDDLYGQRLAAELGDAVTFATDHEADYRARDVRMDFSGCRFELETPQGERSVSLPLPGRFNVANALGAVAATHAMGAELDALLTALERGVRVPGRFEPVQEGQDFAVLVDYAHTPDSLDNVLRAARELARGRVVCVFGAGGDRDRGKRPLMGEIAARLADVVVVTSDNPRSEPPEAIVREIVAGADIDPTGAVQVEVDRRVAIARAIALARADDVVVIAGKGHEQGQEFAGGRKVPFDDATVAREALRARGAQAAGAAA